MNGTCSQIELPFQGVYGNYLHYKPNVLPLAVYKLGFQPSNS